MASGFRWTTPPEQAFPQMYESYVGQVTRTVYSIVQSEAPQAENWMKDNAPWTDRTGNARQGLNAQAFLGMWRVWMMLDHGVDYGKYLEFKHAGRFAIVAPAVDVFYARVMTRIRQALGR